VQGLISWKHSFKKLEEEYETAKKKKQALDNLMSVGKISQSTYDLFNVEIAEAITDIERQQKTLFEKMNGKMMELKEQIRTLEILLANSEIQHVIGEVNEETYQREINVISMGLETSRKELDLIEQAVKAVSSGNVIGELETEPQTLDSSESKEPCSTENTQNESEDIDALKPKEMTLESKEKQQA